MLILSVTVIVKLTVAIWLSLSTVTVDLSALMLTTGSMIYLSIIYSFRHRTNSTKISIIFNN